jgi:hypothetical protein
MKSKVKKIFFETDLWIVYLNTHDKIKVDCKSTDTTYDYFKQANSKDTAIPKDILAKGKELHAMWQTGAIYPWLDKWKRNQRRL